MEKNKRKEYDIIVRDIIQNIFDYSLFILTCSFVVLFSLYLIFFYPIDKTLGW